MSVLKIGLTQAAALDNLGAGVCVMLAALTYVTQTSVHKLRVSRAFIRQRGIL